MPPWFSCYRRHAVGMAQTVWRDRILFRCRLTGTGVRATPPHSDTTRQSIADRTLREAEDGFY